MVPRTYGHFWWKNASARQERVDMTLSLLRPIRTTTFVAVTMDPISSPLRTNSASSLARPAHTQATVRHLLIFFLRGGALRNSSVSCWPTWSRTFLARKEKQTFPQRIGSAAIFPDELEPPPLHCHHRVCGGDAPSIELDPNFLAKRGSRPDLKLGPPLEAHVSYLHRR